jgi:hypothetical protein
VFLNRGVVPCIRSGFLRAKKDALCANAIGIWTAIRIGSAANFVVTAEPQGLPGDGREVVAMAITEGDRNH